MKDGLLPVSTAHLPLFLTPQTWTLLSFSPIPSPANVPSVLTRGRYCSAGAQLSPQPIPISALPLPPQLILQNSLLRSVPKGLLFCRCGLNSPSPVFFFLSRINLCMCACVHVCKCVCVSVCCQGRIKKKKVYTSIQISAKFYL